MRRAELIGTGRSLLGWSAMLLPTVAVAAAALVHGWAAQRFLIFYVAPLLLAAPLWVRIRIDEQGIEFDGRAFVDGTVFVLSFLRFVLGEVLPFSGHMLFLTYSGLTTDDRLYRWLALALLAETTIFKLWLWRDPASWALGLALGLIAAVAVRARRPSPRPPHDAAH